MKPLQAWSAWKRNNRMARWFAIAFAFSASTAFSIFMMYTPPNMNGAWQGIMRVFLCILMGTTASIVVDAIFDMKCPTRFDLEHHLIYLTQSIQREIALAIIHDPDYRLDEDELLKLLTCYLRQYPFLSTEDPVIAKHVKKMWPIAW